MKTQIISQNEVESVISNIPHSAIFSVLFTKKDNTERKMVCRFGVKKFINPNPSRPRPEMSKNLKTVYDLNKKGYRQFNVETVSKIVSDKTTYIVKK